MRCDAVAFIHSYLNKRQSHRIMSLLLLCLKLHAAAHAHIASTQLHINIAPHSIQPFRSAGVWDVRGATTTDCLYIQYTNRHTSSSPPPPPPASSTSSSYICLCEPSNRVATLRKAYTYMLHVYWYVHVHCAPHMTICIYMHNTVCLHSIERIYLYIARSQATTPQWLLLMQR